MLSTDEKSQIQVLDRTVSILPMQPGRIERRSHDYYAAHKHAKVKEWLVDHPRFKVHVTATHTSWMNLVEVWFIPVERQAVRRGVFKSVPDLNAKLRAYMEGWNKRAHPFVWTKTANRSSRSPTVQQSQIRATSREAMWHPAAPANSRSLGLLHEAFLAGSNGRSRD